MTWNTNRIAHFLERTVIPARVSFLTPDGSPAVASHWFLFEEERLWCAVQRDSFVARCLRQDPRCAFEVAGDDPPYRGVRARGTARLVPERGAELLERLMARYLGDESPGLQEFLRSRAEQEVAIEITCEHWSSWDFTERMS